MRVAVFGVFDLLHEGHKAFLQSAKSFGTHLTVILTQDDVVKHFKQQYPIHSFQERTEKLGLLKLVDVIKAGDTLETLGSYTCLNDEVFDVFVVGYDQIELHEHLAQFLKKQQKSIPIHRAAAFEPTIYKTRLLRQTL